MGYIRLEKKRIEAAEKIFVFFHDPSSSGYAASWAFFQAILILTSAIALFFNDSAEVFVHYEIFAIMVFTFDYGVRFCTCPSIRKFVFEPLNLVDLASILPFYFYFLIELDLQKAAQNPSVVIRLLRIARLARLYRFAHLFQLAPPLPTNRVTAPQSSQLRKSNKSDESPKNFPLPSEIIVDGIEGFNFPDVSGHSAKLEISLTGLERPEKMMVELDDFKLQKSFLFKKSVHLSLNSKPPYILTLKLSFGKRETALSYVVELVLNQTFLTTIPDDVIQTLEKQLDAKNGTEIVVYLKVKRKQIIVHTPQPEAEPEVAVCCCFDFRGCLLDEEEKTVEPRQNLPA